MPPQPSKLRSRSAAHNKSNTNSITQVGRPSLQTSSTRRPSFRFVLSFRCRHEGRLYFGSSLHGRQGSWQQQQHCSR